MSKKPIAVLFIILLTSFTCMVIMPHTLAAPSTPKIYVDPPQIINQSLIPNTTFNVSIKVEDIPPDPGIAGVSFTLRWNPTILTGTAIQEILFHNVTPPDSWGNIWNIKLKFNNTDGSVDYAQTWQDIELAKSDGYCPINGTGTYVIANITLKVIGTGKCPLHLEAVKLGDPDANPIAAQTVDGFFNNAPPPKPALVYIDPASISNVSLTPTQNFTINVNIINASDILSFEFSLSFNASLLHATSILPGSFLPPVTPLTQIDNIAGFVLFNVSLSSSLTGSGNLAVVTFQVEDLGGTPLHLYGVQLLDSLGANLPFNTADGSFDNVLLAKLAVDPPEVIDPTLVPPATFTINVTVADVRGLYGYQFNLTYDPNVLVCLQVAIHDVLGETNYVPNQDIDNLRGFVFVSVAYYSPAVPLDIDSATPLVTIKYRVKSIGSTNLTLTDTQLVDSIGNPITHEDHNGFFQSLIVDIAVLELYALPTAIYKGQSTNVTVTVANHGNLTESFIVNIYYNSTLLTTLNVIGLGPGMNSSITVVWNTASVSWGRYVLSAQVPPLPYETNTGDNTLVDGTVKVKIPGDINGDDTVDIYDALLASAAYGSVPGDPNWNPAADLNGDNTVDIYDVIMLAGYFGTSI
jgi:hypothetical protein